MNLAQLILEGDKYSRVEQILRDGADPNQVDEYATPLLVLASGIGATEMVSLLINTGANVDATDSDDETALHRAAAVGDLDAIRIFLAAGAVVDPKNVDGKTPLVIASVMGYVDTCRMLRDASADMGSVDLNGRTCLHWAALRNDDPALIKFLIEAGADPNLRDITGATPAILAKSVGHSRALEEINRSSSPQVRSKNTFTKDRLL